MKGFFCLAVEEMKRNSCRRQCKLCKRADHQPYGSVEPTDSATVLYQKLSWLRGRVEMGFLTHDDFVSQCEEIRSEIQKRG